MSGIVDDLSVFLADFGEDVVLFPGEDEERPIQGIWDSDHLEISEMTQTPISTRQPVVDVIEAGVSDLEQGHQVYVQSQTWEVVDMHPHDAGMVLLVLEKAQ